jgi:hypothetical protein
LALVTVNASNRVAGMEKAIETVRLSGRSTGSKPASVSFAAVSRAAGSGLVTRTRLPAVVAPGPVKVNPSR